MARTISSRLIHDLEQVRSELKEVMGVVPDADLDWVPTDGMKSFRKQLIEIGAMHVESTTLLVDGKIPKWEDAEAAIQGNTVAVLMESLEKSALKLTAYLEGANDEDLTKTFTVPDEWVSFFGAADVEKEEFLRWLVRHEYYHLGQIITYNWIRGSNPYKRG